MTTISPAAKLPDGGNFPAGNLLGGKSLGGRVAAGRCGISGLAGDALTTERAGDTNAPPPEWFGRPAVAAILDAVHPAPGGGACVWLTGLPCSGKSSTAEMLAPLLAAAGWPPTVLDGDIIRRRLFPELGYTRADRDANVRRVGRLAAEIIRRGGLVLCALISPYAAARAEARAMAPPGRFVEVFVDTPLAVSEERDVKGMFARARRGEIRGFTGVDDPYEPPPAPELTLDTVHCTAAENAARILRYLQERGLLPGGPAGPATPA